MKKFLWKILLLPTLCALILTVLCLLTFHVAAPQYRGLYTGAIADKLHRLESLQSPKIILVGDSNLVFGMDSAMLEEAFDMPVVNLGGHGGLGNGFHLNMAKRNIQPGDIVVVSVTGYATTGLLDSALFWVTAENQTDYLTMVQPEDYLPLMKALPKYVGGTLLRWITGTGNRESDDAYTHSAFNEYGDNVFPRPATDGYVYYPASVELPPISGEGIRLINDLCDFCKEKGAVCLLAAAPVACDPEVVDKDAFIAFEAMLREQINCEMISSYPDYLLHHSLFFDSAFHLTDDGVTLRTELMISDLSQWMENRTAE